MLLTDGQLYAGRYRVVRKLGDGSMGAVYEAENVLIRRHVAIKVLHPHVAERHDALRRFEREAQAAGRIGSPHIVEVLDMGELEGGAHFLVMELLEGETLQQRIRAEGRLDPADAARVVLQLLAGLGAAPRRQNIVHRDLKPANVFLAANHAAVMRGDFVKILDFGVSKFSAHGDDMAATGGGLVLGTPFYMSPEQAKGARHIDHRSDLYAVGVILYECVTGKVPFEAETLNELIFRIVLEAPPPVESIVPDLDPGFAAILHKAMAREIGERYQTAREMAEALAHWLAPDRARVGLDTSSALLWAAPHHAAPPRSPDRRARLRPRPSLATCSPSAAPPCFGPCGPAPSTCPRRRLTIRGRRRLSPDRPPSLRRPVASWRSRSGSRSSPASAAPLRRRPTAETPQAAGGDEQPADRPEHEAAGPAAARSRRKSCRPSARYPTSS